MTLKLHTLFPGQQEGEKIYLVIREHWFYVLGELMLPFLFIIILLVFETFAPTYLPSLFSAQYITYVELAKNIYVMFLLLGMLMIWTIYYLNYQIVTDQRIVDISQNNLFSHTVSELGLVKIEDVTSETSGFFGTMFNFGNVYVQTAGSVDRFAFMHVPRPDMVEKLILDLYQQRSEAVRQTGAGRED